MRIEFTGRQTEVSEEIRQLAEKKLAKLAKVLHGITRVHVVLSRDKHRHIAEVTVHSSRLTLTAVEDSGDHESSLTIVVERLIKQAQRHMGKLRERKRRTGDRAEALWSGILDTESPRVVHSQRFVAKPMTVDEAVMELGHAGEDGLLVFRDAGTQKVSVVYRRKDGNIGLIEPQA
jgi:putative sigma-54 modulation protein